MHEHTCSTWVSGTQGDPTFVLLMNGNLWETKFCPPYEGPPYKKEGPPTETDELKSTASMCMSQIQF